MPIHLRGKNITLQKVLTSVDESTRRTKVYIIPDSIPSLINQPSYRPIIDFLDYLHNGTCMLVSEWDFPLQSFNFYAVVYFRTLILNATISRECHLPRNFSHCLQERRKHPVSDRFWNECSALEL